MAAQEHNQCWPSADDRYPEGRLKVSGEILQRPFGSWVDPGNGRHMLKPRKQALKVLRMVGEEHVRALFEKDDGRVIKKKRVKQDVVGELKAALGCLHSVEGHVPCYAIARWLTQEKLAQHPQGGGPERIFGVGGPLRGIGGDLFEFLEARPIRREVMLELNMVVGGIAPHRALRRALVEGVSVRAVERADGHAMFECRVPDGKAHQETFKGRPSCRPVRPELVSY